MTEVGQVHQDLSPHAVVAAGICEHFEVLAVAIDALVEAQRRFVSSVEAEHARRCPWLDKNDVLGDAERSGLYGLAEVWAAMRRIQEAVS